MSEYWKSLPRKFCDMCKCWFADNKASIEFHERGKRHQENASKRIQEIQKRGIKEAKKQKKLESDMERIERAALAAYKKDLQNEAGSSLEETDLEKLSQNIAEKYSTNSNMPTIKKKVKHEKTKKIPKTIPKLWYEAVTEEGHKYFWNTETSESKWEIPSEGFVSLEEQNQANSENARKIDNSIEDNTSGKNVTCSIGPSPKIDPYGQWVTIEEKKMEEIDLQLPKQSEDFVEVVIPIAKDETKLKFKEKVIGQLTDVDSSEEVTFKKRKFLGSSKRNTRQRTNDD